MSRRLDWEKANKKASGVGSAASEVACDVIRKTALNKKGKKIKVFSDEILWIGDDNSTKEPPQKRDVMLKRLAELEKNRKSLERRKDGLDKLKKQCDAEIEKLEIEAKRLLSRINIKYR